MWPITAVLVTFLLVSASSITPLAERQELRASPPLPAIERMAQWIEAIRAHEMGEADAQASIVASWTVAELSEMFPYLEALLELVEPVVKPDVRPSLSPLLRPRPGGSWPRVSTSDVQRLRALAALDWVRADPDRLLIRGAVLHSDIALWVDLNGETFAPLFPGRAMVPQIGRLASQRVVARAPDADYRGMEYGVVHWDYARALLDAVTPDPSAKALVRQWYRATAAYMARKGAFGEAKPHFARALTLFPSDADLLFSHACVQAAMASPAVQEFVKGTTLPGNLRFDVDSAPAHLRKAEESFRKAIAADPRMVEARIRLARVRAEQDHLDEAMSLIQEAILQASDPVMIYYAQLVAGDVAVASGRADVARAAFQRAVEAFPRAQTPRLALSQLARSAADAMTARAALAPLFQLSDDVSDRYDPWWDYHRGEGRYADALVSDLRRSLDRPSQ